MNLLSNYQKSEEEFSDKSVNSDTLRLTNIKHFSDYKNSHIIDDIKKNPHSLKIWLHYLSSSEFTDKERFIIYEEALSYLSRSYKLWFSYLNERIENIIDEIPTSNSYLLVNKLFEKCLLHLSNMPLLWLLFLDFLTKQPLITYTRRLFDRALESLPLTQHRLIWPSYLNFVDYVNIPITSLVVYKRYLMLEPSKIDIYVKLLKSLGRYEEAARSLATALNSDFVNFKGTSYYELWIELCDIITTYPTHIQTMNIEAIIRSGLRKFTDQVAKLWCSLAQYYILQGQNDKARDIFEESLESINTTNDFGIIFDAYAQYLESVLSTIISRDNPDPDEVDLYIERLEDLVNRRPFLLSSLKIRQNPNSVANWLNRVSLYAGNTQEAVKSFTEALLTINPLKCSGRLPLVWSQFAEYYERQGDIKNAFAVYERAVISKFRSVDDLARIWCDYTEMALRQESWKTALEISRRSIFTPSNENKITSDTMREAGYHQYRTCRMNVLWSLCIDLEQAFGTPATLEACYEKMFDIRVITPNQVISYCIYLEERQYWEKAFSIYERAIAVFRWPHLYDIWLMYLAKFVSRYGGRKLERARELFEQALLDVPKHLAKRFFFMYGKLEETHGLARHAISIYDRATQYINLVEDVYDFYVLVIAKTSEYFGITKTRPFFERGIQELSSKMESWNYAIKLSLNFIEIERNLGEIDRSRAIFKHCSHIVNSKKNPEFWQKWREFEIAHGNEDLFREMLRIKRSVQLIFTEEELKDTNSLVSIAQAAINSKNN